MSILCRRRGAALRREVENPIHFVKRVWGNPNGQRLQKDCNHSLGDTYTDMRKRKRVERTCLRLVFFDGNEQGAFLLIRRRFLLPSRRTKLKQVLSTDVGLVERIVSVFWDSLFRVGIYALWLRQIDWIQQLSLRHSSSSSSKPLIAIIKSGEVEGRHSVLSFLFRDNSF
jgi:hypothetical protein